MTSVFKYIALSVALILCFAELAAAQDFPATSAGAELSFRDLEDQPEANFTVRLSTTYAGSTNFVKSKGGVEAYATRLSVLGSFWAASFTRTQYVWHGLDDIPITDSDLAPWESLYDLTIGVQVLQGKFLKDFYYWIYVGATAGFEADFPGALGLGVSGELAYDIYEGWMLGLVASTAALNPLESNPFGEMELTAALHVSQKHLKALLKALGVEPSEGRQPISFHVAFSEIHQVYRLSSGSNVSANGYTSIQRTMAGAYLDLLLDDKWEVSFGPEYYFYRKFKVYDSKGNYLSSSPLNESLGVKLGIGYMF